MRKLVLIVLFLLPIGSWAANLMQVYQDACANDPAFKAANAEFYAIQQDVPISIANFLPQIALTGALDRSRIDNQTGGNPFDSDTIFYNETAEYAISASQSIFNFANWATLSAANANAKSAAASLCAAAQDLMLRTASAYFAVLQAYDDLRFLKAEKKAIGRQLNQTKERFKVGLIAITGVYEAQAQYDSTVAQEIRAKNEMANRMEELREITGKSYNTLKGIHDSVPLVRPAPARIQRWVEKALCQNYSLKAACFTAKAARENIKLQFSGHLPVVNATAGFSYRYQDNPLGVDRTSKVKRANIGLDASLPIFSGGAVYSATKQARYQYQQAISLEERTRRSVVANTRKAYLGVMSGISLVRADKQTIKSRNSQLEATEAAYDVGTRTMVDVLDAQSSLYDAQRTKARNQYEYLIDTIRLKLNAGVLSPTDLSKINAWLDMQVNVLTNIR